MRIDWQRYRKNTCTKCDKFTGEKPAFGKCMGHFDDVYKCVRRKLFNREAAPKQTGYEDVGTVQKGV